MFFLFYILIMLGHILFYNVYKFFSLVYVIKQFKNILMIVSYVKMNICWKSKVKKKTLHKTTRFEISEELRKRRHQVKLITEKYIGEKKQMMKKKFSAPLPLAHIWWFVSAPLKKLEYLARAKPIITTNIPFLFSKFDKGKCRLLIKSNDKKDHAEAITTMYKNKEELKIMGEIGRNIVKGKISLKIGKIY